MEGSIAKKFNSLSHKISGINNIFRSVITVDYGNNKKGFNNKFHEFFVFIHSSEFANRNLEPNIDNANLIAIDFINNTYNNFTDLDLIHFEKVTLKDGEVLVNQEIFE